MSGPLRAFFLLKRISEDLGLFTTYVMNLSVGLISSIVSLGSFLVILWGLSGSADIPIGPWGTVHIPAYLVWTALLYGGIGTWITIKIGRGHIPGGRTTFLVEGEAPSEPGLPGRCDQNG